MGLPCASSTITRSGVLDVPAIAGIGLLVRPEELALQLGWVSGVMTRRIKVLQLQPDYNVKAHDFADLAEQVVQALLVEHYEVVSAFLGGHPQGGQPESVAERSVYFDFSDGQLKGMRLFVLWRLFQFCSAGFGKGDRFSFARDSLQ